jgi:hypothetical protein
LLFLGREKMLEPLLAVTDAKRDENLGYLSRGVGFDGDVSRRRWYLGAPASNRNFSGFPSV